MPYLTQTQSEILRVARTYLKVPFHHQGRVRSGVDCAGLLVCVAKDLGLPVIDNVNYPHDPDPIVFKHYLDNQLFLRTVKKADKQPGDIVLMSLAGRLPRGHHVGILSDIGIIHAYASARMVVETILSPEFERGILEVYRWQY